MSERTFTVEEIRNYLIQSDSLGDAVYYLKEENIDRANVHDEREDEEDD